MKNLSLKKFTYKLVNNCLNKLGYKIISKDLHYLINIEKFKKKTRKKSAENFINYIFEKKHLSKSQIYQDLFVDFILNKKKGIFCEIGAADGKFLSNTYYLEKTKNWKGILCEPSKYWKKKLIKNRGKQHLVFDAIDATDGLKIFYEGKLHVLSGLKKTTGKSYQVKTKTLNKILIENKIKKIDYLSIDTEGNEYNIISKLDFKKFLPKVVTIEHNYSSSRVKINKLMERNGYKLVFPFFSRFDSFYISQTTLKNIKF